VSWLVRWQRLWDRREGAESLALIRMFVPLVILYDLVEVIRLGLVVPLWAPIEEGGMGPASYVEPAILFYRWFGASAHSAQLLVALTCCAALSLGLGVFARSSAAVLLFSYAQLGQLSPDADRAIDELLRNVLFVLIFASSSATLSLSSRIRSGRFRSDLQVAAWPRYVIVAQLVLLYFFAGFYKQSASWSYAGSYEALFRILQQPHQVAHELPHWLLVAAYPLVQLGALATVLWERAAIGLPLLLFLRATRERGGLLRRWAERLHLLELWVATGIIFHLSLAVLLKLGIFPWGCLALYPALARPDTLVRWAERASAVVRSRLRFSPAAVLGSPAEPRASTLTREGQRET
jgi:hypothetical protein